MLKLSWKQIPFLSFFVVIFLHHVSPTLYLLKLSFVLDDKLTISDRVMNEVVFSIIDSLMSFVRGVDSEEVALQLERQILLIGIDSYLCYSKELKIMKEDIIKIKLPLHQLCDKCIDGYEIPFAFSAQDVIDAAVSIQKIVESLLAPHMPESKMKSLTEIFQYFSNVDFVSKFFQKKKWKQTGEVAGLLRKLWEEQYI